MVRRGTFIVIEGTDGSGKGVQFNLLHDRLVAAGYEVETFDFPQYEQPSSYFVQQYLNGAYGGANDVGPYTASLFYALDRYEAGPKIREALDKGKIVISNRFTGSSMGHQGGKFAKSEQRRGYFIWLDNLEFEMLRIPRPDVNFVLRVPSEIASALIDKKEQRTYTDQKRDIHEADIEHLTRSVAVYDDLCRLFPKDFQRVDCVRNGKLLDIETIQHMLWEKISPLLPPPPQLEMPMPLSKSESDALQRTAEQIAEASLEYEKKERMNAAVDAVVARATQKLAAEAHQKQAEKIVDTAYVTNRTDNVYAFTNALPPQVIAAIMATLSRSSGILSTAVLKAFGEAAHKDKTFVKRVLGTYGDNATHHLVHQQIMVAGASALVAKKLSWSRGAQCTEAHSAYARPELKDSAGNYKYFTPPSLTSAIAAQYKQRMNAIYDNYALLLARLMRYLRDISDVPKEGRNAAWETAIEMQARTVLQDIVPIAHTATVGVYASAATFEKLIIRLLGDELPEAQRAGKHILRELRKTIPAFMEDTDKPDRGGAEVVYRANTRRAIEQLAKDHITDTYAPQTEPVILSDVWPRNELDIVADMLYPQTNTPLPALRQLVAGWPIGRKLEVFDAYIGERLNRRSVPGRAIEKIHYSWDLVTPFSVFRELQRERAVDDLAWQLLTPRGGYEVPQLIEDAGLADEYEDCFDTSLTLHSILQQAGYNLEAQYATLAGHRMRWKLTCNARQTFYLLEQYSSPDATTATRHIAERMYERITEVHPGIAEAMQFVGVTEDPEQNQLAAEQYKQFKAANQ